MSRVGKLPLNVPSDVKTRFESGVLYIEGKLGAVNVVIPDSIDLKIDDDSESSDGSSLINLIPNNDNSSSAALWGTTNVMVKNAVLGVTKGFEKRLTLKGTGYKSSVNGNLVRLSLGFSHDIIYAFDESVKILSKDSELIISGYDKQKVGQVAGEIINFRPVEPYKGKGIYVSGSHVRRKEGKKK